MSTGSRRKGRGAANWPYAIQGVFSTQKIAKVGTGHTVRRTIQKLYWNVREMPDGTVEVQPLGSDFQASGPIRLLPKEEFLLRFSAEPEFYLARVYPALREQAGERHGPAAGPPRGPHRSAKSTGGLDEEALKACFALGITYLERGEAAKAEDIFVRVARLEASFQTEHKHLFNELGIRLRQHGLLDQAMHYYDRALELAGDDDHLRLNRARACFERGDIQGCRAELDRALEINPDLKEARRFREFLDRKGYQDGLALPPRPASRAPEPRSAPSAAMLDRRPFAGQLKRQPLAFGARRLKTR